MHAMMLWHNTLVLYFCCHQVDMQSSESSFCCGLRGPLMGFHWKVVFPYEMFHIPELQVTFQNTALMVSYENYSSI